MEFAFTKRPEFKQSKTSMFKGMGVDGWQVLDIHGPKSELDEIETIVSKTNTYSKCEFTRLLSFYNGNTYDDKKDTEMLKTDDGKLLTQYKNGDIKGKMIFDGLLRLNRFHFDLDELTRVNKKYLRIRHVFRNSLTTEYIEELSKHFPNTLCKNICKCENGYVDLLVCRYVGDQHIIWKTCWKSPYFINYREKILQQLQTDIKCGCKLFRNTCGSISDVYDCTMQVFGDIHYVYGLFHMRGVKVYRKGEYASMEFQYLKNPIALLEWLNEETHGQCYFVCHYRDSNGMYYIWENYKSIHFPYTTAEDGMCMGSFICW